MISVCLLPNEGRKLDAVGPTTHSPNRGLHGGRQSGAVVRQHTPTDRRARRAKEEVRSSGTSAPVTGGSPEH